MIQGVWNRNFMESVMVLTLKFDSYRQNISSLWSILFTIILVHVIPMVTFSTKRIESAYGAGYTHPSMHRTTPLVFVGNHIAGDTVFH